MSKLETPLTLWFWHQVGGLLIEEFVAVRRTVSQGQRLIDAVIVLGEKKRRLPRSIRSVAVCTDDAAGLLLVKRHKSYAVRVYPVRYAVS